MRFEAHACVSEPPSSGLRFCTWLQMRAFECLEFVLRKKILYFPMRRRSLEASWLDAFSLPEPVLGEQQEVVFIFT